MMKMKKSELVSGVWESPVDPAGIAAKVTSAWLCLADRKSSSVFYMVVYFGRVSKKGLVLHKNEGESPASSLQKYL